MTSSYTDMPDRVHAARNRHGIWGTVGVWRAGIVATRFRGYLADPPSTIVALSVRSSGAGWCLLDLEYGWEDYDLGMVADQAMRLLGDIPGVSSVAPDPIRPSALWVQGDAAAMSFLLGPDPSTNGADQAAVTTEALV